MASWIPEAHRDVFPKLAFQFAIELTRVAQSTHESHLHRDAARLVLELEGGGLLGRHLPCRCQQRTAASVCAAGAHLGFALATLLALQRLELVARGLARVNVAICEAMLRVDSNSSESGRGVGSGENRTLRGTVVWFWKDVFAHCRRLKNQVVHHVSARTASTESREDNAVNSESDETDVANDPGEIDKAHPSADTADENLMGEGGDAGSPGAFQP